MSSIYLQVAEQYRQEQRQRMFFVAGTITILCCAIGAVATGSGQATMVLLSVGSVGLCGLMVLAMMYLAPELLLPRLIVASYALQCFWLIFVAGLDIETYQTAFLPYMYQNPYRAVLPNLLVPIGALAAVAFWRLLPVRALSRGNLWHRTEKAPPAFAFYLVASAVLLLAYWPAAVEKAGWWAYGVKVVQHSTGFMPLFMGRYFRQFPRTNRLWLAVLAINAVISLSLGGRSMALIPVGLYLIGRTLGQPPGRRLRSLVLVGLLGIPMFALSGALGAVRSEIGRGDFSIFSLDRIARTTNAVWSRLSYNVIDQDILLNGPGRMIVWPNLTAAILTPESIPYRGFDGFTHEVLLSFKIFALADLSRQDSYDAGLSSSPATLYGYEVDLGTSVEWGLLADGWSRGGPWATILFSFVLTVVFLTAEYILLTRSIQTSRTLLIFGVLIANAIMYPATATLLYILRQSVLDCGLILMLTFLVDRLRPVALGRKRPVLAGATGFNRHARSTR